ncbi:MAG: transpeptidase family protein [Bacteroidales bacterium]|jgi:cell division protein FtsI (penicillin-binding protein 3)|nr:transpeptidase family protein [Bacteroidales bacterium]
MEKNRIIIVYGIVVTILCCIMIVIAYRLSAFSADKGKWAAYGENEKQLHRIDTIPAERGNIYDCNGYLLSSTLPQYTLALDLRQLDAIRWYRAGKIWDGAPAKATMLDAFNYYVDSLAFRLSMLIQDGTPAEYKRYLTAGVEKRSGYYRISCKRTNWKASYDQMLQIKSFPFIRIGIREYVEDGYLTYKSYQSGLISKVEVQRIKPYAMMGSRTIGDIYTDRKLGGKTGLEAACDSLLKGKPGWGRYEYATENQKTEYANVNKTRRVQVVIKEPETGYDIISAIDISMMEIMEKALLQQLDSTRAESGLAALMDVKTGEIKAISNLRRQKDGSYLEGQNDMLVGQFEPGSTFKTASMMAALEDSLVEVDDSPIPVEGGIWYPFSKDAPPIRDHNWRSGGYKFPLSVPQVLHYSSNIGMAKIILRAYRNSPEKYLARLYKMGITRPMKLEIPGAGIPDVNTPETRHKKNPYSALKPWSNTTLPWMSFGYELTLPPIYTLSFYNAIANNGIFLKPVFVKSVTKNKQNIKTFHSDTIAAPVCSEKTLGIIRSMLIDVVNRGTGTPVKSKYIQIAGKTGTSQVHGTEFVNVSFCGYFPAENPQYTCFVMLCKVGGHSAAGKTAGLVFKNIAEQVYVAKLQKDVSEAKDTVNSFLPVVKRGNVRDTENVLKKLNIVYKNQATGEWTAPYYSGDTILLKTLNLPHKTVPNVIGMGAKDAVYTLEKCGLRVTLNGLGKVTRQSIPVGSDFRHGQTITINLD